MLLQFNFKNFKSFKDDTTLDLTATKISEYSDRVINATNEKVLPAAGIFGANAYGKSNVLDAVRYMHNYVIQSFEFGGDNDNKKTKRKFLKPTPFLFNETSKNSESMFEVYFMDSEENGFKTYNYGFTVNADGICEEWLNYKSKSSRGKFNRIFYRNEFENEYDFTGIPAKARENIAISLQRETLIVSLGAKLNIQKLKHIRDWFLNNEFADFGEPAENYFLSRMIPENFATDKNVQTNVIKYISAFDKSIIDFDVEIEKSDGDDEKIKIDAVHKIAGSDKTAKIPLQNESSGTLKMFALYPMMQNVLDCGGVFFIDELNARLHPLLVRAFLITFLNPSTNKNHAQIVFTSHDSWQLNESGLRRDEIWFTEKNKDGVSSLYSLADFVDDEGAKIRKDENFEKNYLLGKYGAIPSLKSFDMFKEE